MVQAASRLNLSGFARVEIGPWLTLLLECHVFPAQRREVGRKVFIDLVKKRFSDRRR